MRQVAILFSLIIALMPTTNVSAKDTAPFGLIWGMSSADAKGQGIVLNRAKSKESEIRFVAQKLPKILRDVSVVTLSFGYNDRLYKIAAVSNDFNSDPYGIKVKERYGNLSKLLAEKYGSKRETHQIDTELWKAPSEFLRGISVGRSWYFSNYNNGRVSVELSIRARRGDTANYVLIFTNNKLEKKVKSKAKANEKDAL